MLLMSFETLKEIISNMFSIEIILTLRNPFNILI
jgi:hypothetical protein